VKLGALDLAAISALPGLTLGVCILSRQAWRERKQRKQWAREDAERERLGLP